MHQRSESSSYLFAIGSDVRVTGQVVRIVLCWRYTQSESNSTISPPRNERHFGGARGHMREWFAAQVFCNSKFTTVEARLQAELWSKMQRFQRIGRRQLEPMNARKRSRWELWTHFAPHRICKVNMLFETQQYILRRIDSTSAGQLMSAMASA